MNILIANKSRLVGEGIKMIVASSFNEVAITVTDTSNSFLEQLDTETGAKWAIILIDQKLSKLVPPRRLHKLLPGTKVCLTPSESLAPTCSHCVRDGFNALLPSSSSKQQVTHVINSLLLGQDCFLEKIDTHSRSTIVRDNKPLHSPMITFRQQQILSLVALGLSNKEVANHFGLSEFTVKRHLNNTFKRLGATNRIEAVRIAAEKSLLLNG